MLMMKAKLKLCAICILLSVFIEGHTEENVMIMTDSEAFVTSVTNDEGYGTISTVYALLFNKIGLPEKITLTPLNRQDRILEQTEYAACSLYRFKTLQRAKKFAFSKMIYFMLHYRLYQQADESPLADDLLNQNRELTSLSALFEARPNSNLLVIPFLSYGDVIDAQLASVADSVKIEWSGGNPHNRLSSLFFAKRADYTLMFPAEVADYLKQNNSGTAYRRYSIANVDHATKGYMMCNKHPDAYAFIDKVNKALPELYRLPEYEKAHTDYYQESEHDSIKKLISSL